jgi:hypothetical protein
VAEDMRQVGRRREGVRNWAGRETAVAAAAVAPGGGHLRLPQRHARLRANSCSVLNVLLYGLPQPFLPAPSRLSCLTRDGGGGMSRALAVVTILSKEQAVGGGTQEPMGSYSQSSFLLSQTGFVRRPFGKGWSPFASPLVLCSAIFVTCMRPALPPTAQRDISLVSYPTTPPVLAGQRNT